MVSFLIGLLVFFGIYRIGHLYGKFKELTAPNLNPKLLSESILSKREQQKLYLDFEYKICKAFVPCASSTLTGNSDNIFINCTVAKKAISKISISSQFPRAVRENMQIYLTSMEHSMIRSINQWEVHRNGRMGESMSSAITNWEIETCSVKSIPQRLRHLYGLDTSTVSQVVTCDDIEKLYLESKSN